MNWLANFTAASKAFAFDAFAEVSPSFSLGFEQFGFRVDVSWTFQPVENHNTLYPPTTAFWTVLGVLDMGNSNCWGLLVANPPMARVPKEQFQAWPDSITPGPPSTPLPGLPCSVSSLDLMYESPVGGSKKRLPEAEVPFHGLWRY